MEFCLSIILSIYKYLEYTKDDQFVRNELMRVLREIDRTAIEETRPILYQMMENIARDLAFLPMELLDENWSKANIAVLAGTGGNGGGI